MLHVKDLLRRILANDPIAAADVRPMPVVPEIGHARCRAETMQRTRRRIWRWSIDEHGGTAGVVSLEDLFEEVVGEIDEGMPEAPSLVTRRRRTARRGRHAAARRARAATSISIWRTRTWTA